MLYYGSAGAHLRATGFRVGGKPPDALLPPPPEVFASDYFFLLNMPKRPRFFFPSTSPSCETLFVELPPPLATEPLAALCGLPFTILMLRRAILSSWISVSVNSIMLKTMPSKASLYGSVIATFLKNWIRVTLMCGIRLSPVSSSSSLSFLAAKSLACYDSFCLSS